MAWVPEKITNHENIKDLLQESYRINHFTNYGPVVRRLEKYFFEKMELDETKCVIVTNNGAHALHALVEGIKLFKNSELTFTTQDFTFPSALQGPLKKSHVVDITTDFQFDLNQVRTDSDGIIVTNLFGNCCDIQKYVDYCNERNKILLFDNATCPFTYYNGKNINNYGNGCIVSLHHTKPIGFGEGGMIVADRIYEESIRSILNFGYKDSLIRVWNPRGNNYKMSDISASYILDFQSNINSIISYNSDIFEKFCLGVSQNDRIKIFPNFAEKSLLSCITIFYSGNSLLKIRLLNDNNIQARQYYPSLTGLPNSTYLFHHIICIPCNKNITDEILEKIIFLLNQE